MAAWRVGILAALFLGQGACTSNFEGEPQLSTYDNLHEGRRGFIDVQEYANDTALAQMDGLYIAPVIIADGVARDSGLSPEQIEDLQEELRGTTCRSFAFSKLRIVNEPSLASHEIRIFVTGLTTTNVAAASASWVAGWALPVAVRAPMGRGSLGVDAEILDNTTGEQAAALKWGRQASLAADGGFTEHTDALNLSSDFVDAMKDIILEARRREDAPTQHTERDTCDKPDVARTIQRFL
ncbi:DUF3313 family protein [Woodsholea maritima]|uniref:DUF3313 family protein n=1 Tax=Woodsholea maritima TaxID=240237 RepID=UPI001461427C|nr:DUF3313 family protein [Woodsholea maritima]